MTAIQVINGSTRSSAKKLRDGRTIVVRSKKNQRWLFYAWKPRFKRVIAHVFGRRTKKTLKAPLKLLKPYKFSYISTDDCKPYRGLLEEENHVVSKKVTQIVQFFLNHRQKK